MLVVMTVIGLRGRRHRMRLDGAVGMAMNDRLGGGGSRSRCRLVVIRPRAWGLRVWFGLVHLHACATRIAIVVGWSSRWVDVRLGPVHGPSFHLPFTEIVRHPLALPPPLGFATPLG